MTKLYVAEFSYGKPCLARVELERETPKFYMVKRDTKEELLGYTYIGNCLHRERDHCFFTGQEAIEYLLSETNKYIAKLEWQLKEAKKIFAELSETLESLKGA